jgi:hypothetical protein
MAAEAFKKIAILDTSAVNRLLDCSADGRVLAHLKRRFFVRVSVLNIAEVCKEFNTQRFTRLMRLLQDLAEGVRPLDTPRNLILRALRSLHEGRDSLNLSIQSEDEGAWEALIHPEAVTDDYRKEVVRILDGIDCDNKDKHRLGRAAFQKLLKEGATPPQSAEEFIHRMMSQNDLVEEYVTQAFTAAVGSKPPANEAHRILKDCPALAGFLYADFHSAYHRGVAKSNNGKKHNPGAIDLWFATYLGYCDRLITHDQPQHRALLQISEFIGAKCEVMLFESFSAEVISEK